MTLRNPMASFGGLALLSIAAATQVPVQASAPIVESSKTVEVDRFSTCTSESELTSDTGIQNLCSFLLLLENNGVDISDPSVMQVKLGQEYGESLLLPGVMEYTYDVDEVTGEVTEICTSVSKIFINRTTDPDPLTLTIRDKVVLP